jgi:hypothetical protein
MAPLDALLKIKANVEGEGAIGKLSQSLGGLSTTAGKVTGGMKGMLAAAGGLSGALGSLVPVVSGVGLVAMAQNAINAADNMNDLRQKTGVSVEMLSRFQQAANASGSSIEAVGGALIKLNRNMGSQNKGAMEALQELGISATDASGKLKSTDQIMLEVADRFRTMPDGAQKTAAAMALFGRSGADMIPMLNGGRQAIESLEATMTGKFAAGADELNDKVEALQGKLLRLGVALGTALMPMLNKVADAIGGMVKAFEGLPGPLQAIVGGVVALTAAFVVLAPAISAAMSIATALAGLQLGATIAGWLGAVGPMVAGITALLGGLLAWITGTLVPALIGIFSGPVGWTILAIAAVVAMAIAFREPIMQFLSWLGGVMSAALKALMAIAYQIWVQPFVNLWNVVLRKPVTAAITWLSGVWQGISKAFGQYVVKPLTTAWQTVTSFLPSAMQRAAQFVQNVWSSAINGIRTVIRSFLQSIANNINSVIGLVNRLIGAFNKLPGPDIGFIPTVSVPRFARGGVVDRATLAMVGEGGQREYIVPESKMASAAAAYLAGARGSAVLSSTGTTSSGNPQINITTGPVLEFDGQRYVRVEDLERAMRATADGVLGRVRTPAGRRLLGVR